MRCRHISMFGLIAVTGACGRLGFSEVSPDPDEDLGPPRTARVVVIGEEGEPLAGQPIAGAYVVVVDADGVTQTLRTGDDGTVTTTTADNTAIHIARPQPSLDPDRWVVYSFERLTGDVDLLVGGRPLMTGTSRTMTIKLPALSAGFTESVVRGPQRCVPDSASVTGATVTLAFEPGCEGESIPLIAMAVNPAPGEYVSLGNVTLAGGMTIDATARTWRGTKKYDVMYENLDPSIATVVGYLAFPGPAGANSGDTTCADQDEGTPSSGGIKLVFDGPPVTAGAMVVSVLADASGSARLVIERVDAPFGTRAFDTALIGPSLSVPAIETTMQRVSWTAGNVGDVDLVAVQSGFTSASTSTEVSWHAYGPAGTTSVRYPELPPVLDAILPPADATWTDPEVQLVSLSDFTYATAVAIVDRDLPYWSEVGSHLPSGTLTIAMPPQTTARTNPIDPRAAVAPWRARLRAAR